MVEACTWSLLGATVADPVAAVPVAAGRVVSKVRRVELLATAISESPAELAVPNVKAGAPKLVNLGIGVT